MTAANKRNSQDPNKNVPWPSEQRKMAVDFFGEHTIQLCENFGTQVILVPENAKYSDVSPYCQKYPFERDELVRGVYIICEKTIYVRDRYPGTLCHEVVHAIHHAQDVCVHLDEQLVAQYNTITKFATPYSSHNVCEWMCESVRAFCNAKNYEGDPASPPLLREIDPIGYKAALSFIESLELEQAA